MDKKKQIRIRNRMNFNINKRKNRIYSINIRNEISKIILLIISLMAILLGCIVYKNIDAKTINDHISKLITFLCEETFISVFTTFLKCEMILIFLAYFIGTSFLGTPLVILAPIIKCIFIGYLGSYMYNVYELQGVLFCLVLLYPYFALTTSALIYGSNESVKMCKLVYECTAQKNTANEDFVKLYFIRYLIIVALTIICIAINSFLISILAEKIIHF